MKKPIALFARVWYAPSAPLTVAASFQGLGDLPGGPFESQAYAVSADGSTVVGWSRTGDNFPYGAAFRWTQAAGIVGWRPGSSAKAVSGDGSMVVVNDGNGGVYRWTVPNGAEYVGSFFAQGADATGWVIVGQGDLGRGPEAIGCGGSGMVGLGDLPGGSFSSEALAVTPDDSVIVGRSQSANGNEACRWTRSGEMVGLGDLPGGTFQSAATAVSGDGSVIAGYSNSDRSSEAFRWTAAIGMERLGGTPDGGYAQYANGVSGDGSTIVGEAILPGGSGAFIWDSANGIRLLQDVLVNDYGLDLTGWRNLWTASAISFDGRTIVGNGPCTSGDLEAFVAHIPEPATLVLLALGGVVIARRCGI
jgi:uncharacterized membrane protein